MKTASYRCSTAPIDISIHAPTSTIAIADLMKSLSLIRFTSGSDGLPDSLTEIARHFQTTWATACAYIAQPLSIKALFDAQSSAQALTDNAKGKQALPSLPLTNQKEVDSLYLEADAEGNLLVLHRDASSEFAEDRRRLKVVSEMHLGESKCQRIIHLLIDLYHVEPC